MENRSMNDLPQPLNPPDRLLCGPGPSNIDPRVLQAMQLPMLGHLDPEWHRILEDLVELLQLAYRRSDGLTIALSASGTSGMEAGLASLAEPGDTVIVAACGFFGNRMIDIARRHGARGRALGRRLLLLVQPEVPGRPARHVSRLVVTTGDGAHPQPNRAGAVQLRLRGARGVLDHAPGEVPPHDAERAVLRPLRGAAAGARGGPGGPVAPSRRGGRPPAGGAERPWI